jgi:flavin-binding protein dodecin
MSEIPSSPQEEVWEYSIVVGGSANSLEDAINSAVAQVAKNHPDASWFKQESVSGAISNGKVTQFQVTIRVGYVTSKT